MEYVEVHASIFCFTGNAGQVGGGYLGIFGQLDFNQICYRYWRLPPERKKSFRGWASTLAGTAMLMRGNRAPVLVSIMLQEMRPTRSPVHLNKAPPLAPDWTQQVVCNMAIGSDARVTMPRVTVGRTLSSSEKSENPAAITGSPGCFIRR